MADLQETIGAVIRRERRKRGRTMKALAVEAALSVVYLGEIERGKKYPSALVLERLAQGLGLTVSDVLEQVAAELRGTAQPQITHAVGVRLPAQAQILPAAGRRLDLRAAA